MAGVQRLHEGEHLRSAHLADDEAVGSEAQRRAHQLLERDRRPDRPGVAGRASRRTRWSAAGSSSTVSSIVTMRSPGAQRPSVALSSDVLPDDVAPLTTTLHRPATSSSSTAATASDANASRSSDRSRKRRIDRHPPSGETGGMTAQTRDPSGRRASTIGVRAVEAPPERGEDALGDEGEVGGGDVAGTGHVPVALDPHVAVGVDEHLVDGAVAEQRVERAEPVEAGHGGPHERLAGDRTGQRRDPPQVGAHDGVGVAALDGGGPAQLGDEVLVDGAQRGHCRAPRSSRCRSRGTRDASSPASTARATASRR